MASPAARGGMSGRVTPSVKCPPLCALGRLRLHAASARRTDREDDQSRGLPGPERTSPARRQPRERVSDGGPRRAGDSPVHRHRAPFSRMAPFRPPKFFKSRMFTDGAFLPQDGRVAEAASGSRGRQGAAARRASAEENGRAQASVQRPRLPAPVSQPGRAAGGLCAQRSQKRTRARTRTHILPAFGFLTGTFFTIGSRRPTSAGVSKAKGDRGARGKPTLIGASHVLLLRAGLQAASGSAAAASKRPGPARHQPPAKKKKKKTAGACSW